MRAERRHNHRPAGAVVSRIVDVLHARSHVNAAPHVNRVIRLYDVLAAIVQFAIAEEKAEATIGEVGLVIFADRIGDESNARPVLLAMPPGASRAKSQVEGLIDFRVGEGFSLAVIPAEAAEGGQVMSEILLEVHAESVLAGDAPGMICDIWSGCEACFK